MFDHWAMPVIRRRWAALAVLFSNVNRATGWRLSGRPAHYAHRRATS
jgi:hypothetical protein